jgi:hypothetical protein
MLLPTNVSNNGLVMFGRRSPELILEGEDPPPGYQSGEIRGVALPVLASASVSGLGANDAGLILYDPTVPTLRFWDGSTWRQVLTP